MPKISIKSFKGIFPSIAPRLLPEGGGQVAIDSDLSSGSLTPYRAKVSAAIPGTSSEVKSIYYYTDKNGVRKWLHFENVVNVERAPIANDLTSRIYYSGDGKPKASDSDKLLDITPYYFLGVPAPSTAPVATVNPPGTGTPDSRVYVVTHVTAWGEESAPSLISNIVDVGADGQVTLSGIPQPANPANYNPVTKIYIYRSVSGTESTSLQFVDEVNAGTFSYVDTKADTELNEGIPTLDGNTPPDNLFGLLSMGNGIMVGFTESEVCFCEPYQPHSWPNKYKIASTDTIIGGGVFGNRLVVCTNNKPFMIVGSHPDSMSTTPIKEIHPCISATGIVSMAGGVIFPTPEGLIYIGSGGIRWLTEGQYTEEDWKTLRPEEFKATQWNGKYVAFTSQKGYIFDLNHPDRHTHLSYAATAVHSDSVNKNLHFNEFNNSSNEIYRFHAASTYEVNEWKSKEFFYTKSLAFTAGQVFSTINGVTDPEIAAIQALYDAISASNIGIFNGEGGTAEACHVIDMPFDTVNVVLEVFGDITPEFDGAAIGHEIIFKNVSSVTVGSTTVKSPGVSFGGALTEIPVNGTFPVTAAQFCHQAITGGGGGVPAGLGLGGAINGAYINKHPINGDALQVLPIVPPQNKIAIKWYVDQVLIHQVDVVNKEVFRLPVIDGHEFAVEIASPMTIDEINFATSVREL